MFCGNITGELESNLTPTSLPEHSWRVATTKEMMNKSATALPALAALAARAAMAAPACKDNLFSVEAKVVFVL